VPTNPEESSSRVLPKYMRSNSIPEPKEQLESMSDMRENSKFVD